MTKISKVGTKPFSWLYQVEKYGIMILDYGKTKKMWIEDIESIKAKLSLISSNNLAGVAEWDLCRKMESIVVN